MISDSYEEILKHLTDDLISSGIPEEDARCDAWFLFEEAFHMRRAEYFLKKTEPVSDAEGLARLASYAEGRKKRIPVQYLIGRQEFMGLTFSVDPSVLIPRADTEVLVERVLKDQESGLIPEKAALLDLCTGSGCIFLSLLKLGDFAFGIGTDLSGAALRVARSNAEALGLRKQQVCFSEGDLFEALSPEKFGLRLPEGFDVITANPPYIAESERPELMPEVVLHEPEMALFADRNGLVFYERIIAEAPKWLKEGGRLYFEIGCTQGEAVRKLLAENGAFEADSIRVLPDLAGLPRVVTAVRRRGSVKE